MGLRYQLSQRPYASPSRAAPNRAQPKPRNDLSDDLAVAVAADQNLCRFDQWGYGEEPNLAVVPEGENHLVGLSRGEQKILGDLDPGAPRAYEQRQQEPAE